MFKKLIFLGILLSSTAVMAESKPIHIVAAENFYGNIAKQIGGEYVQVYSIMSNPNQDPHLFSANIATAKAIADADIIIYNGIDYDSWMDNLISANPEYTKKNKNIIIIANLINKKPGNNPHIWYDPNTMLIYAKYLNQKLITFDPAHKSYYQNNLIKFNQNYQILLTKINLLKTQYQHTAVIATEPVFNDMAKVLGLNMSGDRFQLSIMNSTSPSAQDTKDFEDKLKHHQVRLLIYNKQVSNPLTQRMQMIAKQNDIPAIGVTETQPMDQENYITWMELQLRDLDKALSHGHN